MFPQAKIQPKNAGKRHRKTGITGHGKNRESRRLPASMSRAEHKTKKLPRRGKKIKCEGREIGKGNGSSDLPDFRKHELKLPGNCLSQSQVPGRIQMLLVPGLGCRIVGGSQKTVSPSFGNGTVCLRKLPGKCHGFGTEFRIVFRKPDVFSQKHGGHQKNPRGRYPFLNQIKAALQTVSDKIGGCAVAGLAVIGGLSSQ